MLYVHTLHDGWWCQPVQTDTPWPSHLDWLPATVPGTVQQDLLAADLLPDPYNGMHEKDVQWVGERDWIYRCSFDLPVQLEERSRIDLVCDGLDTEATVWLNGHEIFTSDNMFLAHRAAVKSWLRAQGNELRIHFRSPWVAGKEREEKAGKLACWNGDTSRLYMRKAQYHYGWDWGPTILTVGPWLPIRLEGYEARIVDCSCLAELSTDLQRAVLPISLELDLPAHSQEARLVLQVSDPSGVIVAKATLPAVEQQITQTFSIDTPRLWWPDGYGEQPRYQVQATLWCGEQLCDQHVRRIGLRRVELIRRPLRDEEGESFFFRINNVPIFCGGVNWIPADLLLPRVTEDTYRRWLTLAKEAHMVMVRVWGGGIYEAESFYETCDELGLLVWQDFMFACGIYPANAAFVESVRAEAEFQIKRLRSHACIVLWCGNNEDYWIARSKDYYTPGVLPQTDRHFLARVLYEGILPALCAQLDPTRPYWPGSPYGGSDPNSPKEGDRHVWEVWNEPVDRYQNYASYRGRFVSEFGMLSAPARETLERFTPPAERYLLSPTLAWHNKAEHGEKRLAVYLRALGCEPGDLADFIYLTQFNQAEALSWALRGWRRYWRGEGREAVAGALIWQLNDCWPALSWAIVDSELRPKPAYYAARRALAPLALGSVRVNPTHAAIWVMNQGSSIEDAEIVINRWTRAGQHLGSVSWYGRLPANCAIELPEQHCASNEVLDVRLQVNGTILACVALWPDTHNHASAHVQVTRLDKERLRVSSDVPVRGVWLIAGDGVKWSDNGFDIMPNAPHIITASGLGMREVTARWFE